MVGGAVISELIEAFPTAVSLWSRLTRKKAIVAPPRCVLIVEDNQTNAKLLGLQLESLGYQHKTCGTALSGLDMAREEKPQFYAAFIDLNLPGHDGYWLAEQMATDNPSTRLIIATAQTDFHVPGGSEIRVVTKPINTDSIRRVLNGGARP